MTNKQEEIPPRSAPPPGSKAEKDSIEGSETPSSQPKNVEEKEDDLPIVDIIRIAQWCHGHQFGLVELANPNATYLAFLGVDE